MEETSQLRTFAAHSWHGADLHSPERESVHVSLNSQWLLDAINNPSGGKVPGTCPVAISN